MPTPETNPIDLTTLGAVKAFAEVASAKDDDIIQACITGFSQYVLNWSGRDSLNSIADYTEVYNGNGALRLFLRNSPITAVTSVQAGNFTLTPSAAFGQFGYFIEQSKKSLAFRTGNLGTLRAARFSFPGNCFARGIGNIQVIYKAGYDGTPADLEYAIRHACAINYKRRAWLDMKSKSISAAGGTGTITYQDWAFPPEVERVLWLYQRGAIIT